jgi:membrane protein DedA with SNARE-associated domain
MPEIWQEILAYIAVATACFMEGEAALITSAFTAKMGLLNLNNVYIVGMMAFIGTLASDWMWFFIGKSRAKNLVFKKEKLSKTAQKIDRLLEKYPYMILLGYRYIYGLRTVIPMIIGMSNIKIKRFLVFSLFTVINWTIIFTALGYLFGSIIESRLKAFQHYQLAIIIILLLGLIGGLLLRNYTKSKLKNLK